MVNLLGKISEVYLRNSYPENSEIHRLDDETERTKKMLELARLKRKLEGTEEEEEAVVVPRVTEEEVVVVPRAVSVGQTEVAIATATTATVPTVLRVTEAEVDVVVPKAAAVG
mmetsp:Transcript_765/g.1723  ORF Transcript_765/g.1723 Transcript_765/m.1723 type:complete len:113 (-) Transcript_765:134-472(-)